MAYVLGDGASTYKYRRLTVHGLDGVRRDIADQIAEAINKKHLAPHTAGESLGRRKAALRPSLDQGAKLARIDAQAQVRSARRENISSVKSRTDNLPPESGLIQTADFGTASDTVGQLRPAAVVRNEQSVTLDLDAQKRPLRSNARIDYDYMYDSARKVRDRGRKKEGGVADVLCRYVVAEVGNLCVGINGEDDALHCRNI
jgi:hypothetical protein